MYQFVIPIHHVNWSTRSVLEGISQKYKPKQIYVVTSDHEIKIFKDKSNSWDIEKLNGKSLNFINFKKVNISSSQLRKI